MHPFFIVFYISILIPLINGQVATTSVSGVFQLPLPNIILAHSSEDAQNQNPMKPYDHAAPLSRQTDLVLQERILNLENYKRRKSGTKMGGSWDSLRYGHRSLPTAKISKESLYAFRRSSPKISEQYPIDLKHWNERRAKSSNVQNVQKVHPLSLSDNQQTEQPKSLQISNQNVVVKVANLKGAKAIMDVENASLSNSSQVGESKLMQEVHHMIKREISNSSKQEELTSTDLGSGQLSLDHMDMTKYFSQLRTLSRSRCVLKMVCYLSDDAAPDSKSYGEQLTQFLNNAWDRLHPKFVDRFFGFEQTISVERTHDHSGCILKYNSCPMNIINMLYLSASLQKGEPT